MAKNFRDSGSKIQFTAPSGGVVGGAPVIIGNSFVLPLVTVAETVEFTGQLDGSWILDAVSGDVADEGTEGFWDDSAKNITLNPTGNTLVGVYGENKVNGVTTVKFRLNGISI